MLNVYASRLLRSLIEQTFTAHEIAELIPISQKDQSAYCPTKGVGDPHAIHDYHMKKFGFVSRIVSFKICTETFVSGTTLHYETTDYILCDILLLVHCIQEVAFAGA